jgi:hypothetical protein
MILEETLQEHLKRQKLGKEETEYDLIDVLIKAKEHGDLEVPITLDNIKAVILVCLKFCYLINYISFVFNEKNKQTKNYYG